MDIDVRENLPTIVIMTLIGAATCAFALFQVHENAGSMNASTFSTLIFIIPCVFLVLISLATTIVANRIGRQLYLVMLVISLVFGVAVMVITSSWLTDPVITEKLLANSPGETVILPILGSPFTMLRDVAAFVVCPTIGCIAGAWIGSRLHPVEADRRNKGKKRKRRFL